VNHRIVGLNYRSIDYTWGGSEASWMTGQIVVRRRPDRQGLTLRQV